MGSFDSDADSLRDADKEAWKALLTRALIVIDSLRDSGYGELDFRLGGGTVLMFRFDHRVSRDVDLFIDDAQALSFVSPRLNDVAAAHAATYTEQANSVKLVSPEGDIDFIIAGSVTQSRAEEIGHLGFNSRRIKLETTSEILAKKMLYRAASFKPRDVFDMSAALELAPEAAARAIATIPHRVRNTLKRRLDVLAQAASTEPSRDILMTETGKRYAPGMFARVASALGGSEE